MFSHLLLLCLMSLPFWGTDSFSHHSVTSRLGVQFGTRPAECIPPFLSISLLIFWSPPVFPQNIVLHKLSCGLHITPFFVRTSRLIFSTSRQTWHLVYICPLVVRANSRASRFEPSWVRSKNIGRPAKRRAFSKPSVAWHKGEAKREVNGLMAMFSASEWGRIHL